MVLVEQAQAQWEQEEQRLIISVKKAKQAAERVRARLAEEREVLRSWKGVE